MARYVALLRGINLGGHNKVPMSDLRALVESLGHTEVSTYINSGNVVFTSGTPELDRAGLARAVEEALATRVDVRVPVMVRSHAELADTLRVNPFPEAQPNRLLISFMQGTPDADAVARATEIESGADEFRVVGTTLFLHCPDGVGRSKLAASIEKRLGVPGTARNLTTVRKLLDMTAG
ncbi:uncharacterized protein (DUF1697 family) [Haloactinopolyspora alba]|uniref:Uncharacterized protein (DUF1697 family) n=1 Tax=Haloactinopolyspora alba TaxID=648780 RepID=A0A2P8EFQ0_9ACTN|nr:DUF1697 domain-containing protein [Haloactinopolyspora alba]PSL08264.1 uncharacterized protein (DUF1697 family) [Haloactinopolyspora alba]